jgi:L-cystine uptake protein TcyP (sodium:dicarboxylate symporter family)
MSMTHYMELLATNQPWNLLIFMAGPVVLAETLAITELYLLFTREMDGAVRQLNRFAGIVVGIYFGGIIVYLMANAVLPITRAGEWRTVIDVIAVGSYLLAGLPLIWIALQEFGIVNSGKSENDRLRVHAICVAIFLVVGHVAMIFGMLDPAVFGFAPPDAMMNMEHGAH